MADELNRWLRWVRPRAGADAEGWAESAEADELLARIHARVAGSAASGARSSVGLRRGGLWVSAGVLAAAAAVVVALVVPGPGGRTFGPGTGLGPHPSAGISGSTPVVRPAAQLLSDYVSCPALLAGLRRHTAQHVTAAGLPGVGYGGFGDMVPLAAGLVPAADTPYGDKQVPAGTAPGSTSGTNDQVHGVDEPDLMKTDGDTVVTVTDGTLRVIDAASRRVTGSLDLSLYAGWQAAQLLVAGDHALVLLAGSRYGPPAGAFGPVMVDPPVTPTKTTALFVDLSGPAPKVTGSLHADGGYLAARLVGDTVRLVAVSAPTIAFPHRGKPSTARNQQIVRKAPLSAWQPTYTLSDGTTSSRHTVPCTAISHPADYTGTSLITVYTLTLGRPDANPRPISVVADGSTVYATATSLYVASNPSWWTPADATGQRTEFHRFDIAGTGQPRYLGSGSVPGRLLNQYSLSDYHGYLRLATTSRTGQQTSSSVFVLDDATLKSVGSRHGLGTGERIYAVRFAGPLAYVVTFRQVDPLYILDLSDPRAPTVAGTLKVSGYSTYLHPAGDGRLIGVGAQVGRGNEPSGVQVSLYDVSNPTTPRRTGNVVGNGAGGGALDPHAFLYWPRTGLVVVPEQSGAALALRVHGSTLTRAGTVRNPVGTVVPDDGQGIVRSMIVAGQLWTLSGSGIQVLNQASLHRTAWIAFS